MSDVPTTSTTTFRVRAYELDPTGRVPVQTLCNYLQEAAGNHASALGLSVEQLLARGLTWFLARLHLEIDAYPALGSSVAVETWPSGEDGLYATRDYVWHDADGTPMGRGTSAWLLVDVNRRRPVRIPDYVSALRVPDRSAGVGPVSSRLNPPATPTHRSEIGVRYGDLDVNHHANNVHYVGWAIEALPVEVIEARRLASLEIHFRAETTVGDVIVSEAQEIAEGEYLHRLVRRADGRDVALARTRWR